LAAASCETNFSLSSGGEGWGEEAFQLKQVFGRSCLDFNAQGEKLKAMLRTKTSFNAAQFLFVLLSCFQLEAARRPPPLETSAAEPVRYIGQ
jgi:hypothetical protein